MLHRVDRSPSTPAGFLRPLSIAASALVFALAVAPVKAQEWSQYLAFEDRFSHCCPKKVV